MEKRRVLTIVGLIFVFAAILGNIYVFSLYSNPDVDSFMIKIAIIFALIALLAAVYYLVTGFKKESARFMKFYIYCFILVEMTTIFSICITAIGLSIIKFMLPSIIPATIVFLALNILLLKHDLGKRLSLNLSYLCVLLHIGLLFLTLINPNTKPDLVAYTLRWLANISLSFVLMIMQHLKYYDKAQRNTK